MLARRIGPFPEIVATGGGGGGFETPAELLAAMRRLQGDPALRARLAAAGRAGFQAHWSERVVVPRYLDVVRRTAERKGNQAVVAQGTVT